MNELNKIEGWLNSNLTDRGKKELHELYFEGDYLDEMQLHIAQEKGYETYADYQKENTFEYYIDANRELDPNGHAENFGMFKIV